MTENKGSEESDGMTGWMEDKYHREGRRKGSKLGQRSISCSLNNRCAEHGGLLSVRIDQPEYNPPTGNLHAHTVKLFFIKHITPGW